MPLNAKATGCCQLRLFPPPRLPLLKPQLRNASLRRHYHSRYPHNASRYPHLAVVGIGIGKCFHSISPTKQKKNENKKIKLKKQIEIKKKRKIGKIKFFGIVKFKVIFLTNILNRRQLHFVLYIFFLVFELAQHPLPQLPYSTSIFNVFLR